MKTVKTISTIITVLVSYPIWIWLYYQILLRVQATELMWFLFWIYVPVVILTAVLNAIVVAAGLKS